MVWIGRTIAFNLLKRLIRLKFPNVRRITTEEFAQSLADSTQPQPLILDARNDEEYTVSHLAEAKQMSTSSDLTFAPALKGISKATPIVVYCSVGYRSAKLAQLLKESNFENVSNLEGGLFQWVNEGRSIVQAGQPTQQVHPYNAVWGRLLKQNLSHSSIGK